MRLSSALVVVTLSFLTLTACAAPEATPTAPPIEVTEPAATPSPSRSETASRTEPVRYYEGDCSRVLDATQLDDLVGEGWLDEDEFITRTGADMYVAPEPEGTLGGLSCRWLTPEEQNLTVLVLPEAEVTERFAGAFDSRQCAPSYDAMICRVARSVDGRWILASSYGRSDLLPSEDTLLQAIDSVGRSASSGAGTAEPVTRTDSWWNEPACDVFATAMRFDELAEGGFELGFYEGSEQAEQTMFAEAGVAQLCPFYSAHERMAPDEEFRLFSVVTYPGGGWMFDALARSPHVEPVDVAGATEAVIHPDGDAHGLLYATDGVNVLEVIGGPDDDFSRDVAERALAVLGSR